MTSAAVSAPHPRLACMGVTMRFGGLVAVNDVDLAVPSATIVGLVGPNGAGKTTLFGVLSGLLRPSEGKVFIDGYDVTGTRPQIRAARGLARTFQHPELFSGLTVRDNLVLAHRARHAKSKIWSDFFTMGSLRPSTTTEKEVVDQLVDLLGLDPIANLPALGLPLGMARLVELGRALASSPTVLLLDEPSSGLDSAESAQLQSTLRRVATERAISVLLVEHDVELVMRLCAAIYVLDFGALIASGSPREIQANPAVQAAYLGQEVAGQEPTETDAAPCAEGLMDNETRQPMLSVRQPEQPDHLEQANGSVQALAVQDLSVRYGEASALNGVSFSIDSGTVLAVLGANGAGKSSLVEQFRDWCRRVQARWSSLARRLRPGPPIGSAVPAWSTFPKAAVSSGASR